MSVSQPGSQDYQGNGNAVLFQDNPFVFTVRVLNPWVQLM